MNGIQCGAINLSRVMRCTEVKRSYERGEGRKEEKGLSGGGGKRREGATERRAGAREQSGDIKRPMQLG